MMRRFKKILKYVSIAVIVIVAGLVCYVKFVLPRVGGPENIKVEMTPASIARGSYLANSVCACMDCHSKRDWSKFAGPIVVNTLGQGGEEFGDNEGLPGQYYAKNITPFAIQDWTDGEILRAIACGVDKDGKALFPIMPYLNYGTLDRKDLFAIIAYLRTLPPIKSNVPESESDFPMNFIINTIPRKAEYSAMPSGNDKVNYGKYLFTAASCNDCHTRQEKGKPVAGMELAGGFSFPLSTGGNVNSANITPDMETGIGKWSEEAFVKRFKVYADSAYITAAIKKGDYNTVMPWMVFATMTSGDLKAIYAYLRTIRPVKNNVIKFIPG
jgi:hypothetical protein